MFLDDLLDPVHGRDLLLRPAHQVVLEAHHRDLENRTDLKGKFTENFNTKMSLVRSKVSQGFFFYFVIGCLINGNIGRATKDTKSMKLSCSGKRKGV